MKYNIFILTLFTLFTLQANAQTNATEKAFIKSLIEKEYRKPEEVKKLNLTQIPYSVSLDDEGDPYTVEFTIIAHEDLNSDSIPDYIIFRDSSGALGGNVHSNQQYFYYIMSSDTEIAKSYRIDAYAPFLENIIDDADYKNKTLTAEISQNFRVYDPENLQSATVRFVYKDDNLYEQSYLSDCELAKMKDKTIFKPDLASVETEDGIDIIDYTNYHNEKYEKGDTIIQAALTGCDNLHLTFRVSIKAEDATKLNQKTYDKAILDIIHLLIEKTRYKTKLKKALAMYNEYKKLYTENKARQAYFDDTWNFFVSSVEYQKWDKSIYFTIEINNTINQKQDNSTWAVATRQK